MIIKISITKDSYLREEWNGLGEKVVYRKYNIKHLPHTMYHLSKMSEPEKFDVLLTMMRCCHKLFKVKSYEFKENKEN